jgi:23S rRNA pseudouridine2605 synthase
MCGICGLASFQPDSDVSETQVRRMCDAIGHPVTELTRIAFGPLRLTDLAPGQHRRLTAAEIERLRPPA